MTLDGDEAAKIKSLHLAASDIAAATTTTEVYESAVETAANVLGFDVCGVFVAREDVLEPVAGMPRGIELEPYDVEEGILGRTYRKQESHLVENTHEHEDAEPAADEYVSGISVPLGEIGVLQAISTKPGYYDEGDLELAELLAVHIEEAVSRIASEQDLRESKRKIQRLHEVATSMESCTNREELLETAVEAAGDILEFDWCLVASVRDGSFVVEAVSEDTPMEVGQEIFPADEGVAGAVRETNESLLVHDAVAHDVANPAHDAFRSGLVVPLGEDGVFGTVSNEPEAFDEQDLELAELLAANVAEASARIEARESLRERQRELDLLKEVQSRVLRHNLRNDLNVIEGAAQSARDASSERAQELLGIIEHTAHRLTRTCEKVREIKRVVDHPDAIQRYPLSSVIEPVVGALDDRYDGATIDVEITDDEYVVAHQDLPLAVQNLVENGIEHNTGSPTVEVRTEIRSEQVVIRVSDDGPGIPDHETTVIRRNRETDLQHGSGAGLWLVSWVVERSDGDLRFLETDEGTTVEIELQRVECD